MKVQGVKISPNPVVPGKQATFNISASTGNSSILGVFLLSCQIFIYGESSKCSRDSAVANDYRLCPLGKFLQ